MKFHNPGKYLEKGKRYGNDSFVRLEIPMSSFISQNLTEIEAVSLDALLPVYVTP